jgi:hypothetical protein
MISCNKLQFYPLKAFPARSSCTNLSVTNTNLISMDRKSFIALGPVDERLLILHWWMDFHVRTVNAATHWREAPNVEKFPCKARAFLWPWPLDNVNLQRQDSIRDVVYNAGSCMGTHSSGIPNQVIVGVGSEKLQEDNDLKMKVSWYSLSLSLMSQYMAATNVSKFENV